MFMCVFSMLSCMTFVPAKAATYDYIPITGTYMEEEAKKHLDYVNEFRKKNGKQKIKMDADLMVAAKRRAAEIVVYFSHTRPDGTSYATSSSKAYGENICMGYNSMAKTTFDSFYESKGHHDNMLRENWTTVGVAAFKVGDYTYWVQLYGISSPKSQNAYKKPYDKTVEVKALGNKVSYEVQSQWWNDYSVDGGYSKTFYLAGSYKNEIPANEFEFPISPSKVKWSSSNSSVAKVTSKGVVYGLKKGTVTITAKTSFTQASKKASVKGDVHVTFKTNGGKLHNLQARDFDGHLNLRKADGKSGYLFKGWFLDKECKTPAPQYAYDDMTVYAKWWKLKVNDMKTVKVSKSSDKLVVKYSVVDKADGYQVYISRDKGFKNTTKALFKKGTYTSSKLPKGKYYVKMRAYRIDSAGNRIYGAFSDVKTVKI